VSSYGIEINPTLENKHAWLTIPGVDEVFRSEKAENPQLRKRENREVRKRLGKVS
jgi:hypothetical protein